MYRMGQQLWQWIQLQNLSQETSTSLGNSLPRSPSGPPPVPNKEHQKLLSDIAGSILSGISKMGLALDTIPPNSLRRDSPDLDVLMASVVSEFQDTVERSTASAQLAVESTRNDISAPGVDAIDLSTSLLLHTSSLLSGSTGALARGLEAVIRASAKSLLTLGSGTGRTAAAAARHPALSPLIAALESNRSNRSALSLQEASPNKLSVMATPSGSSLVGSQQQNASTDQEQLGFTKLSDMLSKIQKAARKAQLASHAAMTPPTIQSAGLWLKSSMRFHCYINSVTAFWMAISATVVGHFLILSGSRAKGLEISLSVLGDEVEQAVSQIKMLLMSVTGASQVCYIRYLLA